MAVDERLQEWVVGNRVEPLDWLFLALSYAGSFGLVWLVLAAVVAARRRRAGVLARTAIAVALADLCALALKAAIGRERPYVASPEQQPLLTTAFEHSLPSGHAATSFAGAVVLAGAVQRLAPALLALAAAIALSRVYVGVHYPSDVVAGAALGALVGLAVLAATSGARALRSPAAAPRRSPPPPPAG